MISSFLVFLVAGSLAWCPIGILARSTDVVCLSSFDWMENSRGQNPCLIAAYLQASCNGGQFIVNALQPGLHYIGPTHQNTCQCSSVTYNAVSACGLCQESTILSWSEWNFNCTTVYPGLFAPGIPSGIVVPQWAFQDVTTSDLFNVTLAQAVGDNPESTAKGQSTGSLSATLTAPSASLTFPPQPSIPPRLPKAAGPAIPTIVAGVVGGVVGCILIIVVITIFVHKEDRAPLPPPLPPSFPLPSPPPPAYQETFPQVFTLAVYTTGTPSSIPEIDKP